MIPDRQAECRSSKQRMTMSAKLVTTTSEGSKIKDKRLKETPSHSTQIIFKYKSFAHPPQLDHVFERHLRKFFVETSLRLLLLVASLLHESHC